MCLCIFWPNFCCSANSKLKGSLSHGLNDHLFTEGHCWFASKMNNASEILNVASIRRTSNVSREILKIKLMSWICETSQLRVAAIKGFPSVPPKHPSASVSCKRKDKGWMIDEFSFRTFSVRWDLRPKGKWRKLAWQVAWHENTKYTRKLVCIKGCYVHKAFHVLL